MASYPNPKPRGEWGQQVKDSTYQSHYSQMHGTRGYDMSADYAMPYPPATYPTRDSMYYPTQPPVPYMMGRMGERFPHHHYHHHSPQWSGAYPGTPFGMVQPYVYGGTRDTRPARHNPPTVAHHHHHHHSFQHHHHHHHSHHHHHHHHHHHQAHDQPQQQQHHHHHHHQQQQHQHQHQHQHHHHHRQHQQQHPNMQLQPKGKGGFESKQQRQKPNPKEAESTPLDAVRNFFITRLLLPELRKPAGEEHDPKIKECIDEYCAMINEFIKKAENDEEIDAADFAAKLDAFKTKYHHDEKLTNWISERHLRSQLEDKMMTFNSKKLNWKESTRPKKSFEGKGGNVGREPRALGNRGESDKEGVAAPPAGKGKGKGKGAKGEKDREKVSLAGLTFKEGSSKRQQAKKTKELEKKKKAEAAEAARQVQTEDDAGKAEDVAEEEGAAEEQPEEEAHEE